MILSLVLMLPVLPCLAVHQAVNPVVLGLVRAEQTALYRSGVVDSPEEAWRRVMPLQIHGDAAFAGLGMVLESLQLADLPGFTVGGSVHVIINNQVWPCHRLSSSRCLTSGLCSIAHAVSLLQRLLCAHDMQGCFAPQPAPATAGSSEC